MAALIGTFESQLETSSVLSSSSDSEVELDVDEERNLPEWKPPPFTVSELHECIPAHCWKRDTLKSFSYLFRDILLWSAFAYTATTLDGYLLDFDAGSTKSQILRYVMWAIYGYYAGLVAMGLWVLGHDCGHQAFSEYRNVNYFTGLIVHSLILTPYTWRISHAQHHAATNHMTKDTVHVPKTRSMRENQLVFSFPTRDNIEATRQKQIKKVISKKDLVAARRKELLDLAKEVYFESPLYVWVWAIGQQLHGFAGYVSINTSGSSAAPLVTSHFLPNSYYFRESQRKEVIMSNIGFFSVIAMLGAWIYFRGFWDFFRLYHVPITWCYFWVVGVSYIHHIDPKLPRLRGDEFTFLRGALMTIDFDCHPWFFHGLCETHLTHHIFSRIPHYNAWEATECIRNKLGPYYNRREEHYIKVFWKIMWSCRFVEDEGDVVFFKDGYGKAQCKAAPKAE